MATIYVAREREATDIPIDAVLVDGRLDISPEVQGREFFDIRLKGEKLTITAGKFVGLVPLNSRVFIHVEPKTPVWNLLAILSAVNGDVVELQTLEREYRVASTAPHHVLAAIALAFTRSLGALEVAGLRKTYRQSAGEQEILRGRLEFGASVQRLWGRGCAHSAVCAYFDLTSDTPENQLLRYTCHLLLTNHLVTGEFPSSVRALAHFEELFMDASVRLRAPTRAVLSTPQRETEPAYRRALLLAQMIVSRGGVDLLRGGTGVPLPSLLVDMETLFERYVRHVLSQYLGSAQVLDGNAEGSKPLYDDRIIPSANPDAVVRQSDYLDLIIEVKYKARENRNDIEQVLTYSMSYRAPVVVLVLPAETSADHGLSDIGTVNGVRVCRYRFDLSAASLPSEERAFAKVVESLLTAR